MVVQESSAAGCGRSAPEAVSAGLSSICVVGCLACGATYPCSPHTIFCSPVRILSRLVPLRNDPAQSLKGLHCCVAARPCFMSLGLRSLACQVPTHPAAATEHGGSQRERERERERGTSPAHNPAERKERAVASSFLHVLPRCCFVNCSCG